ncbi:hypothetical protein SFRURICE_019971 [Spodoptera frugiperda]|nr:hypothetical protein SFRURICE_019971 [Spodoptera frugiperda]
MVLGKKQLEQLSQFSMSAAAYGAGVLGFVIKCQPDRAQPAVAHAQLSALLRASTEVCPLNKHYFSIVL